MSRPSVNGRNFVDIRNPELNLGTLVADLAGPLMPRYGRSSPSRLASTELRRPVMFSELREIEGLSLPPTSINAAHRLSPGAFVAGAVSGFHGEGPASCDAVCVPQVVHVPFVVEQDEDGAWCASVLLRPGVGVFDDGTTPEEAIADLHAGLGMLLEVVGPPRELTLPRDTVGLLAVSLPESAEGQA